MDYAGKKIIVTGGGSEMGLEMAKRFADAGATVVITGRNLDKLKAAAEGNTNLVPFQCDVSKDEDMQKLYNAMEKDGGIDFLINNAGVAHSFDPKDPNYPLEKQLQEVNIDVNGVLRGVHYFLPMLMKKDKAIIMNVSSALAYVPFASMPVYCGAKSFVHSYTTSLRISLKNTNVRVVELLPPLVDTPMIDQMNAAEGGADTSDFNKMPVKDFVDAVMKGLDSGSDEITPGESWQMWLMSRIAPGFILGQVNKGVK